MELRILDSILHGALKPWKLDTSNSRHFAALVKAAKASSPNTLQELHSQLITLLTDFAGLQKILSQESYTENPLQPLLYNVELPKYKDAFSQFYNLVITGETLRVYNLFLQQSQSWTELVDIRYQVGKLLTNAKVLAKQTSVELLEQGFASVPDAEADFIHFALYYLKHSSIQLYFSIQEYFKNSLKQITTIEDFYLLDLEEPLADMIEIELIEPSDEISKKSVTDNAVQDRFSFGFTGDKNSLKSAISQLCQKIELLNEDMTTQDALLKLFTSKNINGNPTKIYLGCETAQFRYIIDKLAPHFTNLRLTAIEKTTAFYSKNGNLITAQNLSAGKVDNPKEKGTIDNILKHLQ